MGREIVLNRDRERDRDSKKERERERDRSVMRAMGREKERGRC